MRVLVTGAGGALGGAVVDRLLGDGHDVAAIVRQLGPAGDRRRDFACADLADPDLATAAVREAATWTGGFDAIVLLAGAFSWRTVRDSTADDWLGLYRANLLTAQTTIGAALPHLADGGAIVAVGAFAAERSGAGMSPYTASKAGVARLVESLADELADRRIRANLILPAILDTPRNRADMPDADPAGWTSPSAIAEVVAFLASPASRAINGAGIPVTNRG